MEPTFSLYSEVVTVFDYVEVTICLHEPVDDPFRQVKVTGTFGDSTISGFCDSQDGSVHRVRFMPTVPGDYPYTVTVQYGETEAQATGTITAVVAQLGEEPRKGLLEVDPEYPFHFRWSGTKEHFFWNGTTCYLMPGLSEDRITVAIDRLAQFGVNRIRVALCPTRQKNGGRWFEPQVAPREDFTFCYSPWICARPESLTDPGWDTTRFDVLYWRKYEHLLAWARHLGVIVQVIFFVDAQEPQNYPFDRSKIGEDENERRYFDYAVARLGAFSNVEWCLTNEWHLYRPDAWGDVVGGYLESIDPYHHLASIHGTGRFPFRTSAWADFALYQSWDEHGAYDFMLRQRSEQLATGRPMPQVNEEYGYEDHYPQGWGDARVAPARNADSRRRLAWEITMAGCYQTTGESAANGLGGWINGFGDDSMTMLTGYQYLKNFFESLEWWKLNPVTEQGSFVPENARILREEGVCTVVYLPQGGSVDCAIVPTMTSTQWYNPRTGESLPAVMETSKGLIWESPDMGENDWVLLIRE
jgi:hypothetical protein